MKPLKAGSSAIPKALWTDEQREAERINIARYRRSLRQKALMALGGKCAVCGFDDPRALQIDHINGGGSSKKYEYKNRSELYRAIRDGKRDGLQILCANHNWIKRHENKEWGKVGVPKKLIRFRSPQ